MSRQSLGLCPIALANWLEEHASRTETGAIHKASGRRLKAVVPMHTFGHPVELDELQAVCQAWGIALVEDAAESLGSYYKGKHTGTLSAFSALSFNGNKIITTGGGGMVLCQNAEQGRVPNTSPPRPRCPIRSSSIMMNPALTTACPI